MTVSLLMDQVGAQIARVIRQFFPEPGLCRAYIGKGNNGGDALVAAKHLLEAGWTVTLSQAYYEQEFAPLPRKKLRELRPFLNSNSPEIRRPFIILDGLLGLGATGPLRDAIRNMTREINETRRREDAYVFAVDLPTGLDSKTGEVDPDCVEADFTLAAGFIKTALVADSATRCVGRLALLPIEELTERAGAVNGSGAAAITPAELKGLLPRRNYESHKTQFGRIAVVAGSRGTTGAAVLTASGALKAGGGLVTVYAREDAYSLIAAAAPPEVMVRPVGSYTEVLKVPHDVLALGPGLGTERKDEILELIWSDPAPAVIDADGLNILSNNVGMLSGCAGPRLLTPHPGEMERLCINQGLARRELAEWFTATFPVTLLLKGARTVIAERGFATAFNTTGNPGMGTGGVGDVLTGVCAALIGQGLSRYDAARAGAWICGRAAELAIFEGDESQESLSAADLFPRMGRAFRLMRKGCY